MSFSIFLNASWPDRVLAKAAMFILETCWSSNCTNSSWFFQNFQLSFHFSLFSLLHCHAHHNVLALRCLFVPQGGAYPAPNKGGPHPGGVSLIRQHQVRHLRDRGVPAVRSGLWLGAVVSIPQPPKVLVGPTQPHGADQVRWSKNKTEPALFSALTTLIIKIMSHQETAAK